MLNDVTLSRRRRGKTAATPEGFLEEVRVAGGLVFGWQGGPFNHMTEEAVWLSHPIISVHQLAPSIQYLLSTY